MTHRPLTAVQQIQLGTVVGSERGARETLQALVDAGYDGIEVNGFQTRPTPWLVRALTRAAGMPAGRGGRLPWPALLAEFPLSVIALHESLERIESDIDAVIADARALRTERIVVTGMYRFDYTDLQAVTSLATRLNTVGTRLGAHGIRLGYHNHNVEFRRCEPGATAFDALVDLTDAGAVGFELDCYWAATAGVDPLSLLERLGRRVELMHLTDRGSVRRGTSLTPIDKYGPVELGRGNLPVAALIAQARDAHVEAVVVETHQNWIEDSPVRSFEVSGEYLHGVLASL
ncbi:sugar phosphate isomerase/epimerase [Demequina sp. NBRC 110057]|uniref:sugar phosphate isomerase/epimerase family protein n=1 Tax=Demequina sp. NBRC 110057 TaxID=1570346 RepID=UPI000A056D97|nr:sugar phosphate isomerase/epimerase [Demequina sp. NBRC 110057]